MVNQKVEERERYRISSQSMKITSMIMTIRRTIEIGIRSSIPLICLFPSAPTFYLIWFVLRLISLISSSNTFYRQWDDFFYSMYQRAVLFFFEHWIQTKVSSSLYSSILH